MVENLCIERAKLEALLIERKIEISYLEDEIEDLEREIFQIDKEMYNYQPLIVVGGKIVRCV